MNILSVGELFTINDCLLTATTLTFDYFNGFGRVSMVDRVGEEFSWIVTLRQMELLKKNFYAKDLYQTIELARKYKKKQIQVNEEDKDFPLLFEVYDKNGCLIKSLKCNEEECMFIIKCSRIQLIS